MESKFYSRGYETGYGLGSCRAIGSDVCRPNTEPHIQCVAQTLIDGDDDDDSDAVKQMTPGTVCRLVYVHGNKCFLYS